MQECPICFNKFPYKFIEEHAQLCSRKFDNDVMDIDDSGHDDDDEEDNQTLPYGSLVDPNSSVDDKQDKLTERLDNVLRPLVVKQKNEPSILIKIRRKDVCNDLCAFF